MKLTVDISSLKNVFVDTNQLLLVGWILIFTPCRLAATLPIFLWVVLND